MEEESDVDLLTENLSASLVREYLFRLGLKCTLKCMDEELPRTSESYNSRTLLARKLKIDQFIHEYKQHNCLPKSLLQLVLYLFMNENVLSFNKSSKKSPTRVSFEKWSRLCKIKKRPNICVQKNQVVNIDKIMWFHKQLLSKGVRIDFRTLVVTYCECFSSDMRSSFNEDEENSDHLSTVTSKGRSRNNGERNENGVYGEPKDEYDETLHEMMEYNRTHPKKYPPIVTNSLIKEREHVLLESLNAFKSHTAYDNRTRLGPNKENTFQNLKRSRSTSAVDQYSELSSRTSPTLQTQLPDSNDNQLREKSKSISLPQNNEDEETPILFNLKNEENSVPENSSEIANDPGGKSPVIDINTSIEFLDTGIDETNQPEKTVPILNHESNAIKLSVDTSCQRDDKVVVSPIKYSEDWTDEDFECTIEPLEDRVSSSTKENNKNTTKHQRRPLQHLHKKKFSEDKSLEVCESEENQGNPETEFVPLKLSVAIALKQLIIGSAIRSFSLQWMGQSFTFSNNPKFRYGFVQNKGGACGVLASVQGFLLKWLLFEPITATSEVDPLRPTRQEVRRSLVQALAEVLWRAGNGKQAVLVKSNKESHLEERLVYRPDGLTDSLLWRTYLTEAALQAAVEENLEEFTSPLGRGCLRLIISAILSSGIQSVLGDMDEQTPLIDPTGTCSLELVNLLLTGRAVSNVFDNDLQLDSCLLRGISKRSEIGFLSIYEHFNSCQVGSNLKTPRYPIWLVNCDNHFSVVFSPCKQLVSDWRAERQFHLYHYDGLVTQAEETVLNIDTTGFSPNDNNKQDDVPTLELCIKTKWKDAIIHWSSN